MKKILNKNTNLRFIFRDKILAVMFYPFKFKNIILNKFSNSNDKKLRVLIFHDISQDDMDLFSSHLQCLSRFYNFVSPGEFTNMLLGKIPIKSDSLLISFDDGFASNRVAAEKILNPMGISALFFIITDFIDIHSSKDTRLFLKHALSFSIDEISEETRSMSWEDLEYLLETGHTIGAHTSNHKRLAEVHNNDLEDQIIKSCDILEQRLGVNIEHFAYPFGDIDSFSPEAFSVARKRFKYIHTGIRGNNKFGTNTFGIRRDSVNIKNSSLAISSLLEGSSDCLYKKKLEIYDSWF